MENTNISNNCFICAQSEQNVPLLLITFVGKDLRVCPQCMPTLIHKPQELVDILQNITDDKE